MRSGLAAVALVVAATAGATEPAIVAHKVLVLRNPTSALEVRDYRVDGEVVRATSLQGEALILRASNVDLVASGRRSEHAQADAEARVARDREAERAAEEEARARAAERERRREIQRKRPRGGGSVSVASGSALREARTDSSLAPEEEPAADASEAPAESADAEWGPKLEELRARRRDLTAEVAALRVEAERAAYDHGATVDSDSRLRSYQGRRPDAGLVGELHRIGERITAIETKELPALKTELNQAANAARQAGASPPIYRTID